MGRDYKIGLICGLVPAIAALIWVATRPGLSPEARMMRASQVRSPAQSRTPLTSEASTTASGPASGIPIPRPDSRQVIAPDQGREANPVAPAGSISTSPPPTNQPDLTIYELPHKIKTTRFHIVRKEETLSSISQQYFGSPNQWRRILETNKSVIPDANKLQPGTKLIIPE
jgi:nucleoid-associated protein YgaU